MYVHVYVYVYMYMYMYICVIKPANKGSAVLIWGLKEYGEEAYAQLGELEVHVKLDDNPVKDLNKKVITKLKNLKDKGVISDKNCVYVKPEKEAKIGRFYLLPKIHKRLIKVPDRPVVSNSVQ